MFVIPAFNTRSMYHSEKNDVIITQERMPQKNGICSDEGPDSNPMIG